MTTDPVVRLRRLLGELWSPLWTAAEAIERACDEIERLRHDITRAMANHNADLSAAPVEAVWVSVEERLPPVHDLVIANSNPYGPVLADRSTRNPQHGWSCEGYVTHWMPLPPLPQRESGVE